MGQNAILYITDGADTKKVDLDGFKKEFITIGRSGGNDIMVNNPKVSSQHGKFFKQNGVWCYQDLNSTNGTIVNGKRISSVNLNKNDLMIFDTSPKENSLRIQVKLMESQDSQQQQPPQPPQPPIPPEPQPSGSGKKIALIIALSVVLVAAIVVAILLIVKKSGVNGSPEKCATNFVEGLAERDNSKIKKSIHEKMWAEANISLEDYRKSTEGITMEKIKAGTPVKVSSDDLKVYKGALKATYDLDVEDAKMVRITFEKSDGNTTADGSIDIVCVEIDSSWYVIDFE